MLGHVNFVAVLRLSWAMLGQVEPFCGHAEAMLGDVEAIC